MARMRLGVIFGGRSGEHEVSLLSAASVIRAISREKYQIVPIGITKEGRWLLYDGPNEEIENGAWQEKAEKALHAAPETFGFTVLGAGGKSIRELIDFAFPVLHGPFGEDGTIQGLFEMVGIPYAGCGVAASAIAMDKGIAKEVFLRAGLPVCDYLTVVKEELEPETRTEQRIDQDITPEPGIAALSPAVRKIEEQLPYPVFVKPANMGSSVGISKAHDRAELVEALAAAAVYDRRMVVEKALRCREIETSVIGNYELEVSAVGEVIPASEFYDYHTKYMDGGKSLLQVPADLSQERTEEIRQMALKAYRAIDCSGFARVDFFIDKDSDEVYLNEINTIPGFTKYSMFTRLWAEAGVTYDEVIERIVAYGMKRPRL